MLKRYKYYIITITPFLLFFVFYFTYLRNARDNELKREGSKLIIKIEKFKNEKGRLPVSLNEIGVKETEEGPLYYDTVDNVNFIVWYGTSLGESVTYHSNSNKWGDGNN